MYLEKRSTFLNTSATPKDWKVTEAEDDEGDDADQEDFETLEKGSAKGSHSSQARTNDQADV